MATTIVTDPYLRNVLEASQAARDQALVLLRRVEQTTARPTESSREIVREQKLLHAQLAQLREAHRGAHFKARDTKADTAEARQEVDRLHLQLQNLYYEQQHLQNEITACESYEHSYEQLPLIPVEEFLQIRPELADADENVLMVERIKHEHAEREALEQQRQGLLKKKQGLIADNKKRKDDLANLDKDLERFLDAAKPIQQLFERVI